jgi:hypothetical protein
MSGGHVNVWQITTETLLKFVDGGKPRLKKLAIEDLLQMTLHKVCSIRNAHLYHCNDAAGQTVSSWWRHLPRIVDLYQVLSKYEGITIDESLIIKSTIDDLVAKFDETKELQYVVGIDLAPQVAWKSPYSDISVRSCIEYIDWTKPSVCIVASPSWSRACSF